MREKPIRILHIIGAMDIGGAETLLMNLYRKIDRNYIQFDFVVNKKKECIFEKEIEKLGGKIYRCPKYYVYNYIEYRKWWCNFFTLHKEYKILHGHIGSSAPIYLRIAKKYGLYTIAHSHATHNTKINVKNIVWSMNSFCTRYIADFFFGCSKQAGIDRFGDKIVNSSKFKILKNGIDLQRFTFNEYKRKEIRDKYGIDDYFVIGNISRLTEAKNHTFLLEVFKEFNKINSKSVLVLVGEGELKKEIEKKINKLNLQSNVILAGMHSNTEDFYSAFDSVCFPSLHEGLPISLIESQAMGLKCLISDSIPQEVDANPKLIKRLDLNKQAARWANEIEMSNNRNAIENAEELKKKGFDIMDTVKKLETFYLDVIENI